MSESKVKGFLAGTIICAILAAALIIGTVVSLVKSSSKGVIIGLAVFALLFGIGAIVFGVSYQKAKNDLDNSNVPVPMPLPPMPTPPTDPSDLPIPYIPNPGPLPPLNPVPVPAPPLNPVPPLTPPPPPPPSVNPTPWTCLANGLPFPVRRNAYNDVECYSNNGVDCYGYEPGYPAAGSCDPNVVTTPNMPLTCGSGTYPLYSQQRNESWCAFINTAVPPLANPAPKPVMKVTPWFVNVGNNAWRLNANGDAECASFDGATCAAGNSDILRQINRGKSYTVLNCGDPATDPDYKATGRRGYDIPSSSCSYQRDRLKGIDPSLYQ